MKVAPQANSQNQSQLGTSKLKSLNTQYLQSMKTMVETNNPNDDSIIDLQYEKNLSTLDYNRMKESVRKNHAVKTSGTPYTCGEACWTANPGSHHCVKSSEKTDLTKFGVGIILYFKFIKHFIFFFFLFTLLSVPAYIFYASSFAAYNADSQDSLSYIDLLTATTVGAIGFGSTSCGVAKYNSGSTSSATSQNQIYFQCPTGYLASLDTLVYGLVATGTTCSFVDTTDLNTACNNYDQTELSSMFGTCITNKESSCTVTVPKEIFNSDSTCTNLFNSQNIYMKISCIADNITVFDKYTLSKSTVAYVVAACDAAIILIFLIMIYTLKYAQKSATENVQKRAYSASSYTVELRNLPQTMPAEELAAKLWSFLDAKLGEKSVQSGHRVVDVQIVLPNKLIECSKQVGNIIHNKNGLIRDFMQDYVPGFTKPTIDFNGLQEIMKTLISQNHPKLKEAEKAFRKIKALAAKKMTLLAQIQRLKTTKEVRIVSAFVTFSSIPARNKILDTFVSSPLDRIARVFCSCYYDKDISFFGKILRAKTSADPGSILWENLGEPGPKVFVRRTISMMFTLLLWVISGGILIVSTYYKNNFKKSFPTIDCTGTDYTRADAAADYGLGELQKGYLQCYCQSDIISRLNEVFTEANNQTLCLTWFTDKVIETSITFAIVFVVLIINYFVQFVFQGLSQFEKHSTLNKQLATRVIKTFVAQFLNTGLMILIVNAKIDISFWQGKFRDITPLWYENVGSTLLSTMFINIVTVPSVKLALSLLKKIARWWDRRCGSDERITRKKTQSAYESVYFGPEFIVDFRYSQILTLTFVCFLYSGGMPLLYLSSFLQLILTYFFDKIFLLKICQLPKNYDENLESVVRPTLYISLVAHLIFAIFMFGNNEIFSQDATLLSSVASTVNNIADNITNDGKNIVTKFFSRTIMDYNIVLSVVLIIMIALVLVKGILLGLLRRTIFAIFTKDEEQTQKKGTKVVPMTLANYTFFYVIKAEDIAKLIQLTKVTIKSTQNPELINQLKSKLVLLKNEYRQKKQGNNVAVNFIGFYTYDVRLQPRYANEFAIEEMLDDENLD